MSKRNPSWSSTAALPPSQRLRSRTVTACPLRRECAGGSQTAETASNHHDIFLSLHPCLSWIDFVVVANVAGRCRALPRGQLAVWYASRGRGPSRETPPTAGHPRASVVRDAAASDCRRCKMTLTCVISFNPSAPRVTPNPPLPAPAERNVRIGRGYDQVIDDHATGLNAGGERLGITRLAEHRGAKRVGARLVQAEGFLRRADGDERQHRCEQIPPVAAPFRGGRRQGPSVRRAARRPGPARCRR